MINFKHIKPDFNNIDEVYINNLNVWYINFSDIRPTTKDGKDIEITSGILLNPDNVIISKTKGGFELTEIDFINYELKLLNQCNKLNTIETKQFEYYKDFLNKKKINIEWTLNDFYNRYIETKQFYNFYTNRVYKNHEYNNIKDHFNITNERFKYILNRLNTEDKKELINDYKDQLTQLRSKQTQSKFIELINEFINIIDIDIKTNEVINQYKYNPTILETIIKFNNEDGTKNPYYYSDFFIQYKKSLNDNLSKYSFDPDDIENIKTFNKRIETLLIQIAKHYNNVNNFKNSKLNDFETYNYNDNKEFNNVFYLLETHATEILDLKLQNKDVNKLHSINQYYIKTLNQCLKDLNNKFEIDVYNSPLKNKFTELINAFENSITETDLKHLNTINIQTPQPTRNNKPDEVKNIHPKFNPNYWNKECFELFKYIYDEYYKGTKRQLTNIWFYLKEYQSNKYNLKATKEQYEIFILENYQIKITNFDKAPTKWEDKEYGTINEHRINFEDTLK